MRSHQTTKMASTRKNSVFVMILLAVIFRSKGQIVIEPTPAIKTVTQMLYVTVMTTDFLSTTTTTVCPTKTQPPMITPTASVAMIMSTPAPSTKLDCGFVCQSVLVTSKEPKSPRVIRNKDKKTSNKGLNIIKKFEKLEKKAYKCPAGVWTIGYGHTKGVKEGDEINEAQADKFLKEDVKCAEEAIKKYVKVCLTQDRFDALVSFIFNVGTTAFRKSTLLEKVNQDKHDEVPGELKKWIKANGTVFNGLIKRRNKEAKLYNGEK